jgi:four helix bundle protein
LEAALGTNRARLRRDGRGPAAWLVPNREMIMFDALEVTLKFLDQLGPIETWIRRNSASLGSQLGRASESIALDLAEGRSRRDGEKRRHYEMAAGSAAEATAALRIALARRYIAADEVSDISSTSNMGFLL